MSEIDLITPDTEGFPGIITSFALDSCTSIHSTFSYLIDNNIDYIVDVAIYARDTVDMFIQEKEDLSYDDKELESRIANDPFMVFEKNRQKKLMQKLKEILDISSISYEELRTVQPIIELSLLN